MDNPTSKPGATEASSALHDGGFESLINFRDVAESINTRTGRKYLRPGLLFRSARPDEASPADRDRLRSHYGIRTIIDLRTKTEHLQAARKRSADSQVPALLRSNEALAEPVQIPGISYREVNITGGGFEKYMLSKLGWCSYM